MNIAIIGVGGVGGYFGAKICRAREALGAEVYFVARGAHLQAIRDRGLTVRTSSEGELRCRPTLATAEIEELPPLDACLVCVKSYDLAAVMGHLAAKVSERTEIVPLLNGIDIRDRIRGALPQARVYPACAYIATHKAEPGLVVQEGGACRILFGRDGGEPAGNPPAMAEVFRASSIVSEWHEDIRPAIWTKFVFIASFGLVTACFGATLGEVMASGEWSAMVRAVMSEIRALAAASGVGLPDAIVEDSYRKGHEFPPTTRTSFQRDVEDPGRPDERDLFGGTIVRLSERYGVPTPRTRELQRLIDGRKPPQVA
jgi:2-dehydropantoate 2-reductase